MIRGGVVTLDVKDVGLAERFYIETLGMKLVEASSTTESIIDAGDGFRIRLRAAAAGGSVGKQNPIDLEPKVPIEEAIAIYENRGVTFSVERTDVLTTARFHDLDGNPLVLTQKKS